MGQVLFNPNVSHMRGFDESVDILRQLGYNVEVGLDADGFDFVIDKRFPGFYNLKGAVEPILINHHRELVALRSKERMVCSLPTSDTSEYDEGCWT